MIAGMPIEPLTHWLDYRRKRFWAAVLILVYVLGGFFAAPPILRGQIASALQQSLDRPVTLDGVGVNPLTLAVDLRGLHITEKDGKPLAGCERLHVRLSLTSLVHRAWTLGNVSLDGLTAELIRDRDGGINISRLMTAPAPATPAKPVQDQGGVRLIIEHLQISNAAVTFTDRMQAEPFTTRIGPVNAEIERLSTLPDETGKQHVLIELEKGAALEWSNEFGLDPLRSSGHVTAKGPYAPLLLRYLGDVLHLSAPSGSVDLALDYRLENRPDGSLGAAIDHLSFGLNDLVLREAGEGAPLLALPQLRLAGGHLAWPERTAGADSLQLDGLSVALRRQEDGRIALPGMAASAPASPSKTAEPDWAFSLGKVEVRKAKGSFEDRALRETGKIEIASLDLSADSLSTKPGAAFPFSLSAGLAPGGAVKLQGNATALPALVVDAKLTVSDLPVAIAQPYLHDMARLGIGDGKLEAEGDVKLDGADGLNVVGHGEVRSLKLTDEVEKRPVLSWDSLAIDRYSYRQAANELQISQIALGSPYARFQVAADHTTNLTHVMVPAAPPKTPPAPAAAPAPVKISVGRITIAKGSADYGDASLPLPFATHITNLQGHISALSSAAQSASGVSLQGQVDQYGEVNIFGQVNPFRVGKGMKINVVFRNVDFPGLSPYTAKFAGRRIAKGKIDLASQYAIDNGALNGTNKLVIRDMELGERVDVPGAMDLPLDLAISLLKDDEGKINLDLPVSGNVNDPKFDFGAVVAKAIGDVLGDLVTAPFRALAGLFGGDGSGAVGHIDFMPGRSDLEPPEREKIGHVAEILQKRPKMGLVVAGVVDPQADRQKLQRDALDAEMAKALGGDTMVGRQRRFLEGLFEQRIGRDKLGDVRKPFGDSGSALDDPGYIAELRRQVAKTEPLDDARLAALSQARAQAVADALRDPQRVTLGDGKQAKAGDDGRVPLKLEATGR